jgi:hypothetical protein
MALIVAYLFNGPRNYGPVPVELAWLLIGLTIFAFIVLGRRFPLFGYFTIIILCGLFTALVGGRRGRRGDQPPGAGTAIAWDASS